MTDNQKRKMHAILNCIIEYLGEAATVGNNIRDALIDFANDEECVNEDMLRAEIREEMYDPMAEVIDDARTAKTLASDLKTMMERWF